MDEEIKNISYKIIEDEDTGTPLIEIENQDKTKNYYYSIEISEMILKNLKGTREKELNISITDAVIADPAYFNELQRNIQEMQEEQ